MVHEMGQSSLDDILITDQLSRRSPRTPDLKAENDALRTLARQLVEQPQTMLKTLVNLAKDLCQAGTAGVSLLETTPSGEAVFRWVAIVGELEQHEQGTIPRGFSPCGICLERQSPQLYAHPERFFTDSQVFDPPIVEGLVIPLMAANQPLGAIWILSHDPQRQFDAEDVRVMTSLADFTAAALYNHQIRQTAESAQAELRQREAELSLVTNAVPVLISFIDSEKCYRLNNRTYEEWFGHLAAEVYGKPMWEVLGEAAYQTIRSYVEQVLAGQQVAFETEVPYQDGGTRYVHATYIPRFDSQGNVEGFVALVSDISDRKQAELEREQLLARERHYIQQLQELTTAALAINSALSVEQVLNIITAQAASIIGAHQSVTSMTINQTWAHAINAIYLSDKYAQWRDYDEKPDGLGIYACVCHLNRPMRMTQAELEAHPGWKSFGNAADKHPPMRGWLAAPLVGRNGQNIGLIQLSDKYEGEFTEADESVLVQLAQMASVAVENARLYEAEQQARSEAEASREAAQAANRIKDEFLAVLSHELRSPLNPILGWAKLLQTGNLDEARTKQALTTIERNAKLQSELIEDLLDVSRILQGKLSLNMVPVDPVPAIQAAMETVRLAAEAKSIQIQTELDSSAGKILGDPARIQQMIWNLLTNAVKFTPEGGRVEVSLVIGHQSLAQAGQRTEDNGRMTHYAQITVSDTGKGISSDFLPYVFDYFRQEDGATTRRFGGLGLGLAIVRHLVELHGGTIQAESIGEGMGATFTVRLPLMSTQPGTNQSSVQSECPLDLTGVKILVVDDDADTLEYLAFLLEQAGARVTAVASAREALALLTQSKPDLLLSDIGMPDMDGYMLLRQVRTLPPEQGGNIPTGASLLPKAIALTAYAGEINQQQAMAAGFQRHIAKPVEPEALIRAILSLNLSRTSSQETG